MSDEARKIICGNCRVPMECSDRDGQAWGSCPQCGQNESFTDAAGEASKYHARKSLDEVFKGFPSSGGGLTIKRSPMPHFRWITAD